MLADFAAPAPVLNVEGVTLQYKTAEHLITATWRVSFKSSKQIASSSSDRPGAESPAC